MNTRVLVTGGAGYIGSHAAQKLVESGFSPVVYDNLSTGFREAIPVNCDFINGDILDTSKLDQVIKRNHISSVIHFAAKLVVPESIIRPIDYYENNTIGLLSLLKACQANNLKKIVFSSTAAVYGNIGSDIKVTEATPTTPINPYGASKRMCEQILKDFDKAYALKSVCLRYFNVAGASANNANGQRSENATHLIKVACEAALGKRPYINIFGTDYPTPDGTCLRDYIHVEDLALIHVLALNYLFAENESLVLNCGYGRGFSVREVIQLIKKISGVDFEVKEASRREGDPTQLIADSSLLRKTLSWTPKFDNLELICKSALDWEKAYMEAHK